MMAKVGGWIWMGGVIAILIVIQAVRQNEPLASIDRALNGASGLIPLGITVTVIGAALLVGAAVHGMVLDGTRWQPGKVKGGGVGRSPVGGWAAGWFSGNLLWGGSFYEESGISEVKRSWFTGEWLTVHRYLRGTMVIVGLPLAVVGAFGTTALVTDVTAVRLLLLLAIAYMAVRLGYALIRA
jgi:hypothetical protein